MKKFLCFVLVLCLALVPIGVIAEEYDNGYEYEEATDATEYATDYAVTDYATDATDYATEEATGYPTDYATDYATEEVTDYATDDATEYQPIVPIAAATQRWSFGLEDSAAAGFSFVYYLNGQRFLATYEDGLWVSSAEYAEDWSVNTATGYVTPVEDLDVGILWYAKADGLFSVNGSFLSYGSTASVLLNGEVVESDVLELHYELKLTAGDQLLFVTSGTDVARWAIAIQEVEAAEEVVEAEPTVEAVEPVVEIELPAPPPLFEITAPRPIDTVPTRFVDGVQFVPFRATANAYGFFELTWDGATATVTVVGLTSFTVAEAGGFNDNGTVYVPFAFAVALFEVPTAPPITPVPAEEPTPVEEPTPAPEPTDIAEPTPYVAEEPTECEDGTEYDDEYATEDESTYYYEEATDEYATDDEPTDYDA